MFIQVIVLTRKSFNVPLFGTIISWRIFNKLFKNRLPTSSIMKNHEKLWKPTWHLWRWRDARSLLGDSRDMGSPLWGWGPKSECLPSWPEWTLGSCATLPIQWQSCSISTEHSELATYKQHLLQIRIRKDHTKHSGCCCQWSQRRERVRGGHYFIFGSWNLKLIFSQFLPNFYQFISGMLANYDQKKHGFPLERRGSIRNSLSHTILYLYTFIYVLICICFLSPFSLLLF